MTRHVQLDHAWAVVCSERGALGVYCFTDELGEANAGCKMAAFPTRREARQAQKGRHYPSKVVKVRIVLEEML